MGSSEEKVAAGSPASALGLQPGTIRTVIEGGEILLGGDSILSIQGISLAEETALLRIDKAIQALQPDDALELKVLRGSHQVTLRQVGDLLREE